MELSEKDANLLQGAEQQINRKCRIKIALEADQGPQTRKISRKQRSLDGNRRPKLALSEKNASKARKGDFQVTSRDRVGS